MTSALRLLCEDLFTADFSSATVITTLPAPHKCWTFCSLSPASRHKLAAWCFCPRQGNASNG